MKWKIVFTLSALLGLVVIAIASWLWSLPAGAPTTSIEARRAYFFMDLVLGSMGIVQGIALLDPREGLSRRLTGLFATLLGGFDVFVALRMMHVPPFSGM